MVEILPPPPRLNSFTIYSRPLGQAANSISVSNLTKKYQNRVDKAAETTNTVYLRERATLLQDIKRLNIEYDIFKRQYDKEKESGKTV